MVEAGANEVPEDKLLEALELAHDEIRSSARRRRSCARQAGKPKWLDPELTDELEAQHGSRDLGADPGATGLREAGAVVEELVSRAAARRSRWSRPRTTSSAQLQVRASLRAAARASSGSRPSRRRCASSSRTSCARSPTPSRTRRSSSRRSGSLLFDRIVEGVELPFPVGAGDRRGRAPAVKDSMTKQFVKKAAEAIYKELVRKKIAVDKRRPDGRGTEEIRPIDVRGRRQPAHARLRRSSPAARRRSCRCSRSAPRRRGSGSTTSRSRASAATCTTTTSRPTRSGRRASCAARSGATSATVRSRSGRSSR